MENEKKKKKKQKKKKKKSASSWFYYRKFLFIYIYINFSSWFQRYCVAFFIMLKPWRLLPLILTDIQFDVTCFCQYVSLYHIAALVLYN